MQLNDLFTSSYTVSDKVYKGFIEVFNDNNPLHTDAGFAKNLGFEAEVMHGNILNGFLSHFIGECLPIKNVIIQSQQIKFLHPVYLGNTIELQAVIDYYSEAVGVYSFNLKFINQANLKVATGKIQIGVL
ncbi:MAG: MaoC/PaaZ C-terminal domain-containing protein [Bacteroidetes bacterium]|nr:MaoC/PaaZ C-terminal domain-containing protein [Bacteroidota bacterium]